MVVPTGILLKPKRFHKESRKKRHSLGKEIINTEERKEVKKQIGVLKKKAQIYIPNLVDGTPGEKQILPNKTPQYQA